MTELLRPGHNGFLVDDVPSAVAAIPRLASVLRADCRADAEQRFSAQRMAEQYAALYQRILDLATTDRAEISP